MRPSVLCLVLACLTVPASAQSPLRAERGSRAATLKTVAGGNNVAMTVFNTGLLGGVGEVRGFWLGTHDFYVGDLLFVAAAEVVNDAGTVVPVVAVPRGPANRGIPYNPADPADAWTWEAVPGYASAAARAETGLPNRLPATSTDPETWPATWPDRRGDTADPGWAGAWDGLWGKDQFVDGMEVYSHLADDNVRTAAYTPDPDDPTRGGLGLVTRQRVVALRDAGFEDALLLVWDVANTSPRTLARVATGFVAGTISGGDGDSQDDVAGVDAARGLVYSFDIDNRSNQGRPVGYTGFVVLPTPGGDRDLGAALYFAPSNSFLLSNAAGVWAAVNGGLQVQDCTPGGGCDGDLLVSTAPFALPAFSETRFAAALVFGETLADVQRRADDLRAFAAGGLRFDDSRVSVTLQDGAATDVYDVSWTSADPTARVRLDVTANGGRTWSPLATDAPTAGNFPASGTATFNALFQGGSGAYRVRATSFAGGGVGRAETRVVTVEGSGFAVPVLTAPRGVVEGVVPVAYEVYTSQGPVPPVRLFDVLPGGQTVLLADGLPRMGTFLWDTRLAPNGPHRLRLEVEEGTFPAVDESDPILVANVRPAIETPGTYAGRGDGAVEVRIADAAALTTHTYRVDFAGGPERAETLAVTDETTGQTVLAPVSLPATPVEGPLFDGLRLVVLNPATAIETDSSGWTVADGQVATSLTVATNAATLLAGRAVPYDYTLAFADAPVTESLGGIRIGDAPNAPVAVARLVNLTVTNTTLGRPTRFVFIENDGSGGLFSASTATGSARTDVVVLYECVRPDDACAPADLVPTFLFRAAPSGLPPGFPGRLPRAGDVFAIETVKAIQNGDTFRFVGRAAVAGEAGPEVAALRLAPAAPNPARSRTALRFTLRASGAVRLRLFDALGREVAVLADGDRAAGEHTVTVDAARLVPGLYLARLDAGGASATQRFVVVR